MMKKIKLLIAFLTIATFIYAQKTITGIVSNSKGEPLAGAVIVGKGFEGKLTNLDGEYSLIIPEGLTTFIVSYLGYNPKEITIDSQTVINVLLSELEEDVVLVGYGTQKKSKTTGAISSINSKQLTEMPLTNIVQALQGRLAGVDVTQSGSKPGSLPTIRIRGRRSISGPNAPIYVVDGMPIMGGYEDFNLNDIESINILKDAAATAIYGVGGANGVILITTKGGKLGGYKKITVSYDNYYGQSEVLHLPTLFSGTEFAEYVRESRRGVASGSVYKDAAGNPVPTGVKNDFADLKIETFDANVLEGIRLGRNTQYQELMLRKGNIQNHTLGIQGNYEKIAFYVSGSYFKDNGVSLGLDNTRMSFHSRLDFKINNFLKAGLSSYGAYGIRNGENLNPYAFALQQNPLGSPYLADGVTLNFTPTNDALLTNPLFEIIKGAQVDERKTYRFFNSLYAEAKIIDGLTYRVNFGPDINAEKVGRFIGSMTNAKKGSMNQASINNSFEFNWTLENILNYTKVYRKHTVNLTVLHSIQKNHFEDYSISVLGIPVEKQSFHNLGAAISNLKNSSSSLESRFDSYMGRLNYDYANKYLFTATLRRAGKPFKDDLNYGNLPAIALGWNISNEAFIKDKIHWLDALKLRLSWGTVGNNTLIAFGLSSGIGNPNITSELATTKNMGLDFSILRGRISGSLEGYRTHTINVLLSTEVATSPGVSTTSITNGGETQSQGIEANLSTININKGGFQWTSDIVFTKNKEQILSLSNGKIDDLGNKWFIGKPLTAFYDYTKDGIWQLGEENKAKSYGSRVGQIKVTDKNNDGKITAADRTFIGSEVPDWTGSMTNHFSFKGFDLSVMIYARIGQTILSGFHAFNNQLAGRYQQIKVNYWTPKNPTNAYPQPNRDQEFPLYNASLLYFDGSFIKIRNINFGYTFPYSLTQKWRIESLRLFTSIQQPKIWSSYISQHNGVDPEVNEGTSIGSGVTPSTRIITVGVNVKF